MTNANDAVRTAASTVQAIIRKRPRLSLGLLLLVIVAVGLWLLFYAGTAVERAITKRWPPQDLSDLKKTIEQSVSEQLTTGGGDPNVYAYISNATLTPLISAELKKIPELVDPAIEYQAGYIALTSQFRLRIDVANNGEAPPSLDVTGSLNAAFAPTVDENGRVQFRLILSRLRNVVLKPKGAITAPLRAAIDGASQELLGRLNGIFNGECARAPDDQVIRVPSCIVNLPQSVSTIIDVTQGLEKDPANAAHARPVALGGQVKRAGAFVGSDGLYFFSTFTHSAEAPPARLRGRRLSLAEIETRLGELFATNLGQDFRSKPAAVGIGTRLLAQSVGHVAAGSNLQLVRQVATQPESFDAEVRLAKRPTFSCSRSGCTRTECHPIKCYSRSERQCIDAGGDIAGGINLLCKTVQNTVCEAANAPGNLACNTVQEVSKGSCDVYEELRRSGCDANKLFVDKALGRIGRTSGDYHIEGSVSLGLIALESSDSLSVLTADVLSSANAKAKGTLRFMPVDHGHFLTCVSKWAEPFDVTVNIPLSQKRLTARLADQRRDGDRLRLAYKVDKFSLEGKVTPAPFDAVFANHPHLRINCQFIAGVGDLARLVTIVDPESPLVPDELNTAVTGGFKQEIKDLDFDIEIPDLKLELFDKKVRLSAHLNDATLVFSN